MGNSTVSREPGAMVRAAEITWTVEPLPRTEDVDVLTLTSTELLAYTQGLQREAHWLRALLHEAVALVAKLTDDLKRMTRVVEDQRAQIRDLQQGRAA